MSEWSGWIPTNVKQPESEPHRNIEILYKDAAGSVFQSKVSSHLFHAVRCFAWREITQENSDE